MNLKAIWEILKETFSDWNEDKAPRLAAALAYYTMFSIAPVLIIVIAIAGLVLGREAVQGAIAQQIEGLVGNRESALAVQAMIQSASKPSTGIIATVIGLVTLLFGAAGVFGQLQDALNTIWEVQPKPDRGIMETIKERFLSFTMVLGVGFLLLVSLVVSAALTAIGTYFSNLLPGFEAVWQVVNFLVSFGVITLLFAMIFKVLPDAKIAWSDVWIGAAVTALLFTIGKFLIGLYLGKSSVGTAYGAAGSLVVILIWVYYSAQILFLGAEFTQVYARKYGSRIEPADNAVPVTEEARAQQGIPRKEDVAAAAEGKERQVGGSVVEHAQARTQEAAPAGEGEPRRERNAGALAGFIVGVLVGRRSKDQGR
jgi:membrane protein